MVKTDPVSLHAAHYRSQIHVVAYIRPEASVIGVIFIKMALESAVDIVKPILPNRPRYEECFTLKFVM